jgi:tripartite ATP-independent transporter DctM subunit
MIAAVTVLVLIALLVIGTPISFSLLISGVVGLYCFGGLSAVGAVLSTMPHGTASSYEFVTIPMFLLMAEFVLRSGIGDDLFAAAAAWFGRVRGGLGIATAFAGAGFGAVCGSSTAAAATLSSTSMPAMLKNGYEPPMAAGVIAISGTLSMLIPPSLAMVVYGLLTNVSIAKMLMAGVVPGLLVTLTIAATVYFLAWQDPKRAPLGQRVPFRERLWLLRLVGPMILLFGAVTGVIYMGVATPTEASAIGALCSAVIYFARGRRTKAEVFELFAKAARTSCMLAMIILAAHVFSTVIALTGVPRSVVDWVGTLDVPPFAIILILVLIYIILGCFMDQMAILVLTLPVAAPLVQALGFDLIWFGVIVIVTAELGMVTPPFGLNVFVVAKHSGMPVGTVFRGVMPHVFAHLIAIGILLLFPALSLWLPSRM